VHQVGFIYKIILLSAVSCSYILLLFATTAVSVRRLRLKCDGTRAETKLRFSAKRTSPFKSAGASVQSTIGSGGVRISGSNAGYTMFRGSARVLATLSIRQFPLHFPSRASPCAITFQLESNSYAGVNASLYYVWLTSSSTTTFISEFRQCTIM